MKTIFAFIIAAMCSIASAAWDFELSTGQTRYTGSNKEGGDWRQPGPSSQGFRDEFHMRPTSYTIGATGDISQNWKWRAGYADLGKATSVATATRYDPEFDFNSGVCITNCDKLATYAGSAQATGIYATAGRVFNVAGFDVTPEIGLWVYRNKFTMWTYSPGAGLYDMQINNKWSAGPVAGVSIGRKNVSVALVLYSVHQAGDPFPAINEDSNKKGGFTSNVSLRVTF